MLHTNSCVRYCTASSELAEVGIYSTGSLPLFPELHLDGQGSRNLRKWCLGCFATVFLPLLHQQTKMKRSVVAATSPPLQIPAPLREGQPQADWLQLHPIVQGCAEGKQLGTSAIHPVKTARCALWDCLPPARKYWLGILLLKWKSSGSWIRDTPYSLSRKVLWWQSTWTLRPSVQNASFPAQCANIFNQEFHVQDSGIWHKMTEEDQQHLSMTEHSN